MTDPSTPPSIRKLVSGTLIALVVAATVLIAVVLPAEYGIDPLGIGGQLGLVVLSDPTAVDIPVRSDGITSQPSGFRVDEREFLLAPGRSMEYKFRLGAGNAMVYSWTASGSVRSEMHAERDGAPEGIAEFFEVEEQVTERHGSYVAPFPGDHGWYWENLTDDSITVALSAAGYFEDSIEYPAEGEPILREITATSAHGLDSQSGGAVTSEGNPDGDI